MYNGKLVFVSIFVNVNHICIMIDQFLIKLHTYIHVQFLPRSASTSTKLEAEIAFYPISPTTPTLATKKNNQADLLQQ